MMKLLNAAIKLWSLIQTAFLIGICHNISKVKNRKIKKLQKNYLPKCCPR
jgi:hypothetical protein